VTVTTLAYTHHYVASQHHLTTPRYRLSTFGRRAFSVAGPTVWNSSQEVSVTQHSAATVSYSCCKGIYLDATLRAYTVHCAVKMLHDSMLTDTDISTVVKLIVNYRICYALLYRHRTQQQQQPLSRTTWLSRNENSRNIHPYTTLIVHKFLTSTPNLSDLSIYF